MRISLSDDWRRLWLSLPTGITLVMLVLSFGFGASAVLAEDSSAVVDKSIVLGDKLATLNLTPDFRFINEAVAREILKRSGGTGEGVLGIVVPAKGSTDKYLVVYRFENVGHVNDSDADKLNADDILNSYKEGTKRQNEERKALHVAPIYVGQWAEKPHYDKATHHVIWAVEVKNEDSSTAPVVGVNYNTRILGRHGVLSLNLVTAQQNLERDKGKLAVLLQDTTFNKGQTYAEYVPGKDKSAGYGIAGLILGGGALAAAAKFGVFGLFWKWIIAGVLLLKKFIIVGLVAIGGLFSKLKGKKKTSSASAGLGSQANKYGNAEPPADESARRNSEP